MVDRKTTRSFKIDGDNFIAIKRDEFVNGVGKHVVQTMEEHNLTEVEIDQVINELYHAEIKNFDKEKSKKLKEIQEIKDKIKKTIKKPEYIEFKKTMDNPETIKFFDTMSREKVLKSSENMMKDMNKQRADIDAWLKQFVDMKEAIIHNRSVESINKN